MTPARPIIIYGKSYNIKNLSSEIDPEELAAYVDGRMKELESGPSKASTLDLAILTALNIARELLELRRENADLEKTVDEKSSAMIEELRLALGEAQTGSSDYS